MKISTVKGPRPLLKDRDGLRMAAHREVARHPITFGRVCHLDHSGRCGVQSRSLSCVGVHVTGLPFPPLQGPLRRRCGEDSGSCC